MDPKNIFKIEDDFENIRFDKWFKKKIKPLPQSVIERSLRKGKILVNEKKVKSSYKIKINDNKNLKKFIHISTDEVFGDMHGNKKKSLENDSYNPSSPYSASKASSDHLVTSWGRTFKIPYNITFSCNNFGPNQYPEKIIPYFINKLKIKFYSDRHFKWVDGTTLNFF